MTAQHSIPDGNLQATCPVDLHPLDPVPIATKDEVRTKVARARAAHQSWKERGLEDRVRSLKRAAKRMLKRRREVVLLMREEIGKLEVDALMSEALGPLDQVSGWAKVIRRATSRQRAQLNPISFPKKKAFIDLLPRGVVAFIAPWNYPLATHFQSVIPALLTGNGVVIKPSEYTPRVAGWFVDQMSLELPDGLLQLVPGGGAVGEALIDSGVDAVIFTGSIRTGRQVLKRCAERVIPVSAEMGGNDPAIVLSDCDVGRTAAGITHWALHNAGQACGAVELAYVDKRIADPFVETLRSSWSRLRVGPGDFAEVDVSPMANVRQLELVERHVADAEAKGALVVLGGRRTEKGLWYLPTILDNCTDDMDVVKEETFGPVLAVVRVSGASDAIRRTNESDYGLGVSLWTKDLSRAERLAERLECGVVNINNHSVTGAMPQVPWSGARATGYSVANSPYALATYVRPRTLLIDENPDPDPFWLPYDKTLWDLGDVLADVQVGRIERAWKLPFLLRRRVKRIRTFFSG